MGGGTVMALLTDDDVFGAPSASLLSDSDVFGEASPKPKQNTGIAGDIGTALKRGVLQMPGMATGLADIAAAPVSIATGVNRPVSRAADWLGEQTGLQFGKWAEAAGAEYSPAMQQAQQNVEQAKGFLPTIGAVVQNPRVAAQVVAESLPSTLAGGLLARGAMGAVAGAEKLTALRAAAGSADAAVANAARRELLKSGAIAAGIGEGAITAGQQMAQTGYDVDPALAAGTALGAGIGTGVIGGLSGRVAGSALGRRLGLSDIETSMAAGTLGENASKAGIAGAVKRIGAGVVQEGLLEEAPQSYQEQVWQNIAAGKPWSEGAAEAAALGAVAGGVMGGAVNAIPRSAQPAEQPPAVQPIAQELAAAARIPDPQVDPVAAINHPASGAIVKATAEGVLSGAIPPNTPATPATPAAPPTAAVVAPPPQGLVAGVPITETTPAAPGADAPVSTAATSLTTNQVEPAGVPTTGPTADASNQAQIAVPPAQGSEAQPATGAVAGEVRQGIASAATSNPVVSQVAKKAPTRKPKQSVAPRVVQGEVGMKIAPGEVATTLSGRQTTPFPKFNTERGDLSVQRLKDVDKWLLSNAADEAASRGDGFNERIFRQDLAGKTIPSASKDAAEEYLFGYQPDVQKPVTRQLVQATKAATEPKLVTKDTTSVNQGIAAAALPPLQYPKQTASIAGPLPQTATAMPVGRFGAPAQQPKKPAQKFVQPPLTARAQPSETSVLPQTAAQMPVGRFGERAKGVEAPKLYAGLTAEEAANLASRHGQDYDDALRKIVAKPGAWVKQLANWQEVEKLDAKAAAKESRDKTWKPNEKQSAVLASALRGSTGAGRFPKDNDLPMARHNKLSTLALIARGKLRRVEIGDSVEYSEPSKPTPPANVPPNVSADISPDISPDEDLKAARRAKVEALRQRYMAAKPDTAGQAARVATAGGKLAETAKAAVDGGRAKLHELQSRLEAAKSTPVAEPTPTTTPVVERATPPDAPQDPKKVEASNDFNAMFDDIMAEIAPQAEGPAPAQTKTPSPRGPVSRETVALRDARQAGRMAFRNQAPATLPTGYAGASQAIKDAWFSGWKSAESDSASWRNRIEQPSLPTRTAGEAAASAAKNVAGGFGDITDALGALFGTKSGGRLSMGLSFDEDTYAKALPLFKSAVSKFQAAGQDLRELMKALMLDVQRKFGNDTLRNMQPYVVRFMEDVKAGSVTIGEAKGGSKDATQTTGTTGGESLPGVPAKSVQKDDAGANDGDIRPEQGGGGAGSDGGTARPGVPAVGGVGGGKGRSVPGRGRPKRGADGNGGDIPATPPNQPDPVKSGLTDYVITSETLLGEGGAKTKFKNNIAAIRLINELDDSARPVTREDQDVLARYVGWGMLPQAFDAKNGDWSKEYSELKGLLTEEEWNEAYMSTQYAHYTSEEIITNGVYAALDRLGFSGGKILEPGSGVGNFVGLMPQSLRTAGSRVTGIERERISAKIGQYLYPTHNMLQADFTEFKAPDGYFDAAIGNPPFSATALTDASGRKHLSGLSVHNYFFAKSVDQLRPGGVFAMVVSNSFLDAQKDSARRYIGERTKFLGAIRLPNNAFKKNAGTDVTTDLIFLQKLKESDVASKATKEAAKSWMETSQIPDPLGGENIPLNDYYIAHPEMMLGRMERSGKMYRAASAALVANEGSDITTQLREAVALLPANVYVAPSLSSTDKALDSAVVALEDDTVQPGGMYTKDGDLYVRLQDEAGEKLARKLTADYQWTEKTVLGENRLERLKAIAELRSTVRNLLAAEIKDDAKAMKQLRSQLNTQYDAIVSKWDFLSSSGTVQLIGDDPDYPLLAALETDYDKGITAYAAKKNGIAPVKPSAKKMAIFTQRVIPKHEEVTKAETPVDALMVSIFERGHIDQQYISSLLGGRDGKEVIDELVEQGHLFFDPESDRHVLKDEYLSGDVRRKLKIAQASGLNANARALEKVIPEDVPSHNIIGTMGASWISNEIYQDFINEQLGEGTVSRVKYSPAAGSFVVEINAGSDFINTNTLGINMDGGRAADLIEKILNKKQAKIGHYEDGKFILDKESTDKAADKITEIKTRFGDWLFKDADRSEVLTRAYNDTVNNYVVREFDGSMLTFPGKVPDSIIKFRRHQRNAIARILQSGQALLDHVVGAGKTFTVIAAAMEMRRTGIAHKPMVTVPNHLVKQWASDFYRLYPGAKVLAATKNDFARENRRAFLAKIATGDWDAVIIAHSTFGFIQPEKQFEIEFNGAQIKDITDAINELGGEVGDKGDARDKGTKRTVKQLAKMREKLQERIKALRQKPMDNLLDLAELGIDALFVDEAHKFKNLMYTTKMQGVRVGGDPSGSQRAYDMYIKTQQVMKKSGGRGVVFATGTPISNTMAEMYHVLRYLAPKTLTDMGLKTFDAWADAFASAETFWMQSMSGDGYKASTRLEKFINVPSLLRIYDQVADTVTMEDIKDAYRSENKGKEFPIPPVKGGGARSAVSIKRSQAQTEYMQEIASRAKALEQRKGPPQKGQDNMLSIMGDARKAAMDMRLVDKSITERDPNGRIAVAAENVWERYKQYNSVKGTQLIFSDMGTPKKSAAKEMEEYNQLKARADRADDSALQDRATLGDEDAIAAIEDAEEAAAEIEKKGKDWADAIQAAIRGFSIYDDMKEALMEKGIPENEIAFIHSYNTDDQKAALFKAVNSGVIRVLLGSTEKMGAGTNVQERVVALHHLDVPWRPSDVEQREGRVVRQGNKLLGLIKGFEVEIMAYATQDTLDLYMWQTQENKLKMIGQLRTGNVDFEMDNAFEEMAFSAGEMQAAATSNPYLLDEIRVKDQIKKLERKKRSYEGQRNDIINRSAKAKRDVSVLPAEIQTAADIADGERGYRSKLDADNKALTISVNGTDVTGIDNIRKATGAALDAMRDIVVVTVGGTDFKVRSLDQLQDAIKASQKKGDINRIAFDGKEYDLNVWGGVVSNGADAIDAALDKTVSEKIKASGFELGGKEYKSYSSLMDGLRTLIGDREPIKFSVAGQDIIQRSKIKSAVSEALAKAVDGESRELLGKFGDVQVYVEAIPDRKDKSKIILNAQVEYNGSGMNGDVLPAGVWDAAVEPSLAKLMGERVIDKARQIMLNASSNEQSARERLAQARRTLADIESNKIDDEWPGEQELKAARAKHDKVLRQLSGRANKQEPKGPVDDLAAKAERMPPIDDRLYNVAATAAPSPSDSAVYQMAQEGKTAAEILAFLAKASRRPFNRVLANALQKAGLQTSITVDSQNGWSVGNRSYAPKYAAAYSPKADKVALFTPRDAERHVLHELTHAASLKAINAGGAAAMRMTALFKHIEKSGKLEGMYGMSTLDEFVAEVFSNPKFRAALESVPAPAGSTLKTAWDWFVRIVARVLGFQSNGPHTALDRALRDGVALMEENAAIRAQATGGDRYATAWHGTPHVWAPEPGFPHGRPRLDKMGTGEGAQAYGWGWYSAESQEVADVYSGIGKALHNIGDATFDGVPAYKLKWLKDGSPEEFVFRVINSEKSVEKAGRVLGRLASADAEAAKAKEFFDDNKSRIEWVSSRPDLADADPSLYRLDIPDASLPYLLDWDNRIARQPTIIKKLLAGISQAEDINKSVAEVVEYMASKDGNHNTGEDLYERIATNLGKKEASEYLASIGIVGTRYLDGQSRADGNGSSNFVIWDQPTLNRVALLERNGEKLDAIRAADDAVRFNAAEDLPTTITVDGVERPTTNSNGKPIHPTAEGVRSFWRWFGESRVTDSEGRPIVLYHGTVEDFSVFDLEETRNPAEDSGIGFFFATRPKEAEFFTQEETDLLGSRSDKFSLGANVVPVFLAIRNPKIYATQADMFSALNDAPYSRDGRGDALYRQLTKKGFDGVVVEDSMLEGKEGGRWVIAFDPEQIKSATANTGAFSPDDPDIRYNLAASWPTSALPQAKALRDTVATAMRSDANTSWITPFNTQYHKPRSGADGRQPLFKRVFNLVQQFLGDVSKYAVMAQNAAPTLLHEWRTISDVKAALSGGDLVGRKHRADIAAVAMPLYDGTLYGGGNPMNGIKWSDERLRTKYKLTDRQIKLYHEALAAVNVSMDEMAKSVIAQHAKREKVGFDSGMDIDDMSAGVLSNLEDKKQEIGRVAQESVSAQIAGLKEMDRPDEADKLKREFDKAEEGCEGRP
jgi:N12 class adenine-specific DNA methylase